MVSHHDSAVFEQQQQQLHSKIVLRSEFFTPNIFGTNCMRRNTSNFYSILRFCLFAAQVRVLSDRE